jgi:dihydroorotate dehydrogenase (fumarate)
VNLSREEDLLLPLRWVAILRSRVNCDLALTGGVHSAAGVIKAILAGANSVQICSLLYRHPIEAVAGLADGLGAWMDRHGFATLDAFRGRLVRETGSDVGGFERAQYVRTLTGVE